MTTYLINVLTFLQLYKKRDTVSSSDNDMYESNAETLLKKAVRLRSTTVDVRSTEGEAEKGFDEAGGGCIETESKDENPEATKQY